MIHDRVAGVLLGQACGDALGVPYEFGPALPDDVEPQMTGGGPFGFAPGEYSDDTAMAVCIAESAGPGIDLAGDDALDAIAQRFLTWAETANDVGTQTRRVFAATRASDQSPGIAMRAAAQSYADANPGRVGNGALMRTSVVGVSSLDDRDATTASARAVASLTHADPLGLDSCVLWSEAIRIAVHEGRFDVLSGLDLIDVSRRDQWRTWIDEATGVDPRTFNKAHGYNNGFTVYALQAVWAAITWTPEPDSPGHFEAALKAAVRTGDDTDTVAAIAGGLLGARHGVSAIPEHWASTVHGYGYGGHDGAGLANLALTVAGLATMPPDHNQS